MFTFFFYLFYLFASSPNNFEKKMFHKYLMLFNTYKREETEKNINIIKFIVIKKR